MQKKTDKIAVLLHGIVGGIDGRNGIGYPINIDICAKTIKYFITNKYNADFFIHSWSENLSKEILFNYNPVSYLFEKQEFFEFSLNESDMKNENLTHRFRMVSRYASLYKCNELKKKYENNNNFKYKFVVVLRFDIVMFNEINFDLLNDSFFYIIQEPHWPDIVSLGKVHDILFIANSENIDNYCNIYNEIKNLEYTEDILSCTHILAYHKLNKMFPGLQNIKYVASRYKDIEIYRYVIRPELNDPFSKQYGGHELQDRLNKLLKEI